MQYDVQSGFSHIKQEAIQVAESSHEYLTHQITRLPVNLMFTLHFQRQFPLEV